MRGLTENISSSENMEQNKTLSSYAARKGKETNSPSDFVTQFEEPLVLDKNRQSIFGLSQINSMTYSFYCKHILLSIHIN